VNEKEKVAGLGHVWGEDKTKVCSFLPFPHSLLSSSDELCGFLLYSYPQDGEKRKEGGKGRAGFSDDSLVLSVNFGCGGYRSYTLPGCVRVKKVAMREQMKRAVMSTHTAGQTDEMDEKADMWARLNEFKY